VGPWILGFLKYLFGGIERGKSEQSHSLLSFLGGEEELEEQRKGKCIEGLYEQSLHQLETRINVQHASQDRDHTHSWELIHRPYTSGRIYGGREC